MATVQQDSQSPATRSDVSERLRTTMAAMRLSFTWFGTRKSLSHEQKAQAAATFGAEGQFLSAGKKLLDTRDPAYRAVTTVRRRATAYFQGVSLPYPEPGIRLIRQEDVDMIHDRMEQFRDELAESVRSLDDRFERLKRSARQRLGNLYNDADYPVSLSGLFGMSWDFPSVEPPRYLQQLNPALYEQECERVRARFDDAVRLAETAFTAELAKLVEHLTERLSGTDDGKPKIFRDSAVENLREFFERFRMLNIGSCEELEVLVERAQAIVGGLQPQQFRDNQALRRRVATRLAGVQSTLDQMLVDRPRRKILRRPR